MAVTNNPELSNNTAHETAQWLGILEGGATPLHERRDAFRQVLGSLTAPLSHQRHLLILGEGGSGKTSLLDKIADYLSQSPWPTVALLPLNPFLQAEGAKPITPVLTAIISSWQHFADTTINQALADINHINEELGIAWDRSDLLRALSLMKLQTDVDALIPSGDYLPQQQLTNAIRSAIPPIKKLHFSAVNTAIRQLVEVLQHPWLAIAGQIIAPNIPVTQAVFDDLEGLASPNPKESYGWQELHNFHQWLGNVLPNSQYRAVFLLDDWELFTNESNTNFSDNWLTFLHSSQPPKTCPIQTITTCRSEFASRRLTQTLITAHQPAIVLHALSPSAEANLIHSKLEQQLAPVTIHPDVLAKLHLISGGLPLLTTVLANMMINQLDDQQTHEFTMAMWAGLGLQQVNDLWELLYNRIIIAHLPHEANVLKVLACLKNILPLNGSSALDELVTEIHQSQQSGRVFTTSILHSLNKLGLLTINSTNDKWSWANRFAFDLINEKTRWVEASIGSEERLIYLKKVIPLSVQAGEFDTQRVQEAIALASSEGFAQLTPFLEDVLIDITDKQHPLPQRLNGLNCLATLATPPAISQLIRLIDDINPTVHEYSLRNLALIGRKQQLSTEHAETISKTLIPFLDKPNDQHRLLAYQTISTLPGNHSSAGMTALYLKGLSDSYAPIRQLAIGQLRHSDMSTAVVRQAIIDATQDSNSEVREQACYHLQRHPHPKATEALLNVLEHDDNPTLRSIAVRMITSLPGSHTLPTLLTALNWELDTSVTVTLIRALKHFPNQKVEILLNEKLSSTRHQAFDNTVTVPLELQWAIVQTLGDTATTQPTITNLNRILDTSQDDYVKAACQTAIHRIQQRLKSGINPSSTMTLESAPTTYTLPATGKT
jgi:HEAT repeat protein